jgi:predicted DsbA family dithiol-disulfide isomerase
VNQVREELREYAAGVTGVPHFIINGKYHFSGAQDPADMVQLLSKV